MTFRIERSRQARSDLLEIWLSLAAYDPALADRHLHRLDEAISLLAQYPLTGPERDDLQPGIRAILRTPFLVFYRVDENGRLVQVLRVIDARRDLLTLFQDG